MYAENYSLLIEGISYRCFARVKPQTLLAFLHLNEARVNEEAFSTTL